MNCFCAAVLLGLEGHGLAVPPKVTGPSRSVAQHQALREVLQDRVRGVIFDVERSLNPGDGSESPSHDEEKELLAELATLERMKASLEDGMFVYEDVAMFLVSLMCANIPSTRLAFMRSSVASSAANSFSSSGEGVSESSP